jgi:hypothetical protein
VAPGIQLSTLKRQPSALFRPVMHPAYFRQPVHSRVVLFVAPKSEFCERQRVRRLVTGILETNAVLLHRQLDSEKRPSLLTV